ncbi:MAG: helix-turn-helix domain-containing protein [Gemmataceae bacterium]|nr:helix-turn-helix domain-containing protein [Gemmataceae bacterium]
MPVLQRAYRFRLRPTRRQEQALLRQAGARRFVWNWALGRRKAYYAQHGKSIPAAQLSRELTVLKQQPATAWLREVDSQLLQAGGRKHFVAIDRFFPSSKRCHTCGTLNEALALADRSWQCSACGSVHDRDHNAALNIRDEGLRLLAVGHTESLNAQGADVRPATRRQSATN